MDSIENVPKGISLLSSLDIDGGLIITMDDNGITVQALIGYAGNNPLEVTFVIFSEEECEIIDRKHEEYKCAIERYNGLLYTSDGYKIYINGGK